jgi:hypothetical protein
MTAGNSPLLRNDGFGDDPTDDKTGGRFKALIIKVVTEFLDLLGVNLPAAGTLTGASGVATHSETDVTVNQSSTAGYTAWLLKVTQTAVGSGLKTLFDLQVAAATVFKIDNTGSIFLAGLASRIKQKTGTNGGIGSAVLVAGTVTVANTSVTANTQVRYARKTIGGTVGNMSYTISAGVGFTLASSSNTDTSTIDWELIEVIP